MVSEPFLVHFINWLFIKIKNGVNFKCSWNMLNQSFWLHSSSCFKCWPKNQELTIKKNKEIETWNVIDPSETYTNKWEMKSVFLTHIFWSTVTISYQITSTKFNTFLHQFLLRFCTKVAPFSHQIFSLAQHVFSPIQLRSCTKFQFLPITFSHQTYIFALKNFKTHI